MIGGRRGPAPTSGARSAIEGIALDLVRHLRADGDAGVEPSVVGALREARPDLADWWRCRAVGVFAPRTVDTRVAGPAATDPITIEPHRAETRVAVVSVGETPVAEGSLALRFGLNLLTPAESPGTTLLVCTPGDAATFAHMARHAPAATRMRSA